MKTEWVHKKLGDDDVAKIIMGQSPSSASYNDENIGLPFLQGCADFGEVFPKTSVYCNEPLKVAPQNSILMSVRAPVGTINKADQKYIIGRGLCSIVSLINNDYLYYYLLQNKNRLEQKAQGSTFLAINSAEVNDFDVSYPADLSAQRRIAAILASADKVIAATQKTIAKYKQIKQGMMEDLLNEQCTMNNVQWKKVKLGEVVNVFDGTHQTPYYVETGIPFYSVENVTANDFEHTKYITEEEHLFLTQKHKIEKGDILMTRIGSIGVCKYVNWDVNASFYVSLALLKIKEGFDAEYLVQYSQIEAFKKSILHESLTFAYPQKINLGDINNVEIAVPYKNDKPDLVEQRRIAAILSGIDAKIAAEEKVLEKYEKVKKGLMERLFERQDASSITSESN